MDFRKVMMLAISTSNLLSKLPNSMTTVPVQLV